jgi:hypothetical protein
MLYDWWRIFCDLLSKFVRWIKPEPLTLTVRQWLVFAVFLGVFFVLTATASFYSGWVSFEHSEKEKLLLREEAAAEARAEHEDQDKKIARERGEQDKKFAQERQDFEMKFAKEREEQQKQFAQKQKEFLVQVFASPTPEDPAKIAKQRAVANAMWHYYDAQQESQRYDAPAGSDCTILEHQTYTDSNGVIWDHQKYTDSQGVTRESFEPQMPKEIH